MKLWRYIERTEDDSMMVFPFDKLLILPTLTSTQLKGPYSSVIWGKRIIFSERLCLHLSIDPKFIRSQIPFFSLPPLSIVLDL